MILMRCFVFFLDALPPSLNFLSLLRLRCARVVHQCAAMSAVHQIVLPELFVCVSLCRFALWCPSQGECHEKLPGPGVGALPAVCYRTLAPRFPQGTAAPLD